MPTNAALQPGYARVTHVVPEGSAPTGSAYGEQPQGNIITRKLGPLPVWVWVAIGAGLIWYLRRGSSSSTSGTLASGPSPVSSGLTADPLTSSDSQALLQALTNLNGTLVHQQGATANTTPTTTTSSSAAAPAATPAATPSPGQWITVTVGKWPGPFGSLSGIAQAINSQYQTHISWQDIYNWNRSIVGPNPNSIKPGQKLQVYLGGHSQTFGAGPRAGTPEQDAPSYYVVPRLLGPSPFPQNLIAGQHASHGINPGPHTSTQPSRFEGSEEHPKKSAARMFIPSSFFGSGYRTETIEKTQGGKNLGSPSAQGMVTMQRSFMHLSKGAVRRRPLIVQTGPANRSEKTNG